MKAFYRSDTASRAFEPFRVSLTRHVTLRFFTMPPRHWRTGIFSVCYAFADDARQ